MSRTDDDGCICLWIKWQVGLGEKCVAKVVRQGAATFSLRATAHSPRGRMRLSDDSNVCFSPEWMDICFIMKDFQASSLALEFPQPLIMVQLKIYQLKPTMSFLLIGHCAARISQAKKSIFAKSRHFFAPTMEQKSNLNQQSLFILTFAFMMSFRKFLYKICFRFVSDDTSFSFHSP